MTVMLFYLVPVQQVFNLLLYTHLDLVPFLHFFHPRSLFRSSALLSELAFRDLPERIDFVLTAAHTVSTKMYHLV
jgi:hypothetical protein